MDNAVMPETFYVQNITLGHYFVSDIKLQFAPREVKDLTWDDPLLMKKSTNLKDALRSGALRKLSEVEYERTKEMQYQKEKKLLLKEQQNKPLYEKVEAGDDKTVEAEVFDVSKSGKKHEKLDFSGGANDMASYAAAYEIAQGMAYERGDELLPEQFGDLVQKNPGLVGQLLRNNRLASSADDIKHKAYFATPPTGDTTGTGVGIDYMSNFSRDHRYAGMQDNMEIANADWALNQPEPADTDFAEEIIIDAD